MEMVFILGFACGLIVGITLAWFVVTWLHPIDIEETGTSLFPMGSSHVKKSTLNEKELEK
jgi:hypothetical protein